MNLLIASLPDSSATGEPSTPAAANKLDITLNQAQNARTSVIG
jgi:hypothetical protein